jgi:DNA-binding LacI/PurR family transcriptional regulator
MPDTKSKRVTIRDIAKACDVSHQTVSRVINNTPGVSAKKRQHILRVMKEMNYQPNKAAQMLSSNRSSLLETIIVDVDYAGTLAKTTKTMVRVARDLGYSLLVSETTIRIFRKRWKMRHRVWLKAWFYMPQPTD